MHALTSTRPKIQYRVGIDAKALFPFLQIFPLRIGEIIAYRASTTPGMRTIRAKKWVPAPGPEGAQHDEGVVALGATGVAESKTVQP